jgi:4-amino-4-deoxy-L-arabinose transferase-like glycosyltransferase
MESPLTARNGGLLGVAALVAIVLLGLGLRVGEAWDGRAPVYDAAAYAAIAANLERGEGFSVGAEATQPSSNYSPGLPLLVAGIHELSGGVHERLARVVLAVLGTLSVLFAYLLGRRWRAVGAGLVAALVVAVYPALLEYQGMLMSEPLAATLLSGAVLALFWAWDGEALARWLLPGALLGALTLVRPEYLGVAVLLALVVAISEWSPGGSPSVPSDSQARWRRALGGAAVLLAGLAVVVAPWTVRNAVALDRVVPVSTGGGQVLFAGTYLPSDGDPEAVGAGVVA